MSVGVSQLAALAARIETLEKQNRRFKRGLWGLVVMGGAALLLALQPAAKDNTVEAKRFVLRDENGKARTVLYVNKRTGTPTMDFDDPEGKTLLRVGAVAEGMPAGVVFFGENRKPLMILTINEKQQPTLEFYDGKVNLRAKLTATTENSFLSLFDPNEKARASLVAASDLGGLRFFDSAGKPRLELQATEEVTAVWMMDSKGKGKSSFHRRNGVPQLTLADQDGKLRAGLGCLKNGQPLFLLQDENEKALFSKP